MKTYYPDGEFSFGGLGVGRGANKKPIETHLANNPEELVYLKDKIVGYISKALATQGKEVPEDFGQDWIETPAQLPAVSLTPPEQPEEEPEGDLASVNRCGCA